MSSDPETPAVRPAADADAVGIAAIYNHYVQETVVTFEEEPVAPREIARRMAEVAAASLPWLVAERGGILGYAYATRWRSRSGYRFAAEITVCVAPAYGGRGIGSSLYRELFPALAARGIHSVVGGIALPNAASVALHEKHGMRKVAHFTEVGFKLGRWIDVGYWQRTLPTAPTVE